MKCVLFFDRSTDMQNSGVKYIMFVACLWVIYSFVELQTMAFMVFINNPYAAFETSTFFTIIALVAGSGIVR